MTSWGRPRLGYPRRWERLRQGVATRTPERWPARPTARLDCGRIFPSPPRDDFGATHSCGGLRPDRSVLRRRSGPPLSSPSRRRSSSLAPPADALLQWAGGAARGLPRIDRRLRALTGCRSAGTAADAGVHGQREAAAERLLAVEVGVQRLLDVALHEVERQEPGPLARRSGRRVGERRL